MYKQSLTYKVIHNFRQVDSNLQKFMQNSSNRFHLTVSTIQFLIKLLVETLACFILILGLVWFWSPSLVGGGHYYKECYLAPRWHRHSVILTVSEKVFPLSSLIFSTSLQKLLSKTLHISLMQLQSLFLPTITHTRVSRLTIFLAVSFIISNSISILR